MSSARSNAAFPCIAFLVVVGLTSCGTPISDDGAAPAGDQVQATANHPKLRPKNVPARYAATPFGFFDPSCMAHIGRDEVVQKDGTYLKADGTRRIAAPCGATRFDPTGREMPIGKATAGPTGKRPVAASQYNGWLESYNTTSTGALSFLAATWVVPETPAAGNDGQTLFFFNGLEGLPTVESILQPVLAYENGQWFAQSWNCCATGTTFNADTIPVSPGDVIVGTVTGTNCDSGSGLCDNWSIETYDQNTGQSSVLNTSAWGVAENWVFAGVLEVYGVGSCQDLSASGQIDFANLSYQTVDNTGAGADWQLGLGSVTPSCGYGGIDNGSSVTLEFTGAQPGLAVGGSYTFHTLFNPTSCMDIYADDSDDYTQVDEYACNGTPAQTFTVVDAGSGNINLLHPHSGKCIDVFSAGTADGTNVDLYDCNGTPAQIFSIQADANGNVTFVNPNSGKCIDVTGADPADYTKLQIWDCNGGNNQKWAPAGG
jgi:hypothetical protein